MPYLSTLQVRSRRGAIQINVYLYLYLTGILKLMDVFLTVCPFAVKVLLVLTFASSRIDKKVVFDNLENSSIA